MTPMSATEVIAEALAEHDGHGDNAYDDFYVCLCGWGTDIVSYDERKAAHRAHQASVIAALPDIAIVALPADPGDSDDMRWSHWTDETEEAFHEALLGELRRIYAVSAATARAAGGES